MRRWGLTGMLAVALAACHRGGHEPALWVGVQGAPRILAFTPEGSAVGVAAQPPALDSPVRALLLRRDGNIVVLQEPVGGDPPAPVPPAVLISRKGKRLLAFAGETRNGTRLFDSTSPPWAAAEDASGRTWVTGGTSPVIYAADGTLVQVAESLGFPSRGVAILSDGRVAVSYSIQSIALYDFDGTVSDRIAPALDANCTGIGALLGEGSNTLVVATRRFDGGSSNGILLRMAFEGDTLAAVQDDAQSASLGPSIPSALAAAAGRIIAGPSLGDFALPTCAQWVSADLTRVEGCIAPGAQRGVAWIP